MQVHQINHCHTLPLHACYEYTAVSCQVTIGSAGYTLFSTSLQCVVQDPIVTELADVKDFNAAEDYHQQYLEKGGRFGKSQSSKKGCDDPIRCYG